MRRRGAGLHNRARLRQLKWTTTLADSNNTAVSKPRSAGAAWGSASERGRDSLGHFALEKDDNTLKCREPQLLLLRLNSFPRRRGAGFAAAAVWGTSPWRWSNNNLKLLYAKQQCMNVN